MPPSHTALVHAAQQTLLTRACEYAVAADLVAPVDNPPTQAQRDQLVATNLQALAQAASDYLAAITQVIHADPQPEPSDQ